MSDASRLADQDKILHGNDLPLIDQLAMAIKVDELQCKVEVWCGVAEATYPSRVSSGLVCRPCGLREL